MLVGSSGVTPPLRPTRSPATSAGVDYGPEFLGPLVPPRSLDQASRQLEPEFIRAAGEVPVAAVRPAFAHTRKDPPDRGDPSLRQAPFALLVGPDPPPYDRDEAHRRPRSLQEQEAPLLFQGGYYRQCARTHDEIGRAHV